ncbi:MAG: hypothetical protein ACI9WU_002107 [Myxococcota bacterium]|jgi:hypothetical protein
MDLTPDQSTLNGKPGRTGRTFITEAGELLEIPTGWALLPPGDAGLTRRVKAAGPTWTMSEKRGRKVFSQGIWAPAATIERARGRVESERSTPEYARKMATAKARRDREQAAYSLQFQSAICDFLRFDARHKTLEHQLAQAVTELAVPVGSGTVARTKRIPVEQRAESAVIAWLRHQTTAYDDMHIARVKGKRREVRRMLAERSRALLKRYRRGEPADTDCPLARALDGKPAVEPPPPVVPARSPSTTAGTSRGGWAHD